MKLSANEKGYLHVCLTKHNKKRTFIVHRLVAECFIDNPENLPQVNHKDENKQNNNVNNLEWCTNDYNAHYGTSILRRSHAVIQKTKDGSIVQRFESIAEAFRLTSVCRKSIANCCKKKNHYLTAGGFIWEYDVPDR